MNLRPLLATFFAASLVTATALAADTKIGTLTVDAPKGWVTEAVPDATQGTTLRFHPDKGTDFYIEITDLSSDKMPPGVDAELLRTIVAANAESMKAQSVEKELPLQELKSDNVHGYYFHATDPAPKPGEWTYMTQGMAMVGKTPVGFTILSNGKDNPAPAKALAMLRTAHAP